MQKSRSPGSRYVARKSAPLAAFMALASACAPQANDEAEMQVQRTLTSTFVGALTYSNPTKFWTGPFIAASGASSGSALPSPGELGSAWCTVPGVECHQYKIDVRHGARLRVGVDHPSFEDIFGLEVADPTGRVVVRDSGSVAPVLPNQGMYSAEVLIPNPTRGQWTVTVIAYDVHQSQFRMRAGVDSPSYLSGPVRPLLPNLQVIPPFHLGFQDCQQAEVLAYGAQRCLRFSEGPQNVGEGALDLVVHDVGTLSGDSDILVGTQWQRIHYSDGTSQDVQAGTFEYHIQHGHYHHSATGSYELLRVLDTTTGQLERVHASPKVGFCMGDYLIANWQAFNQDAHRGVRDYFGRPTCAAPTPGATQMGLTAGWGDTYAHYVEGNYVDFGNSPDGRYVVRAQTDPQHEMRESNINDNAGYAYIDVVGNTVTVLERGRGMSPWDPSKVVVNDGRPGTLTAAKTY